MILNMFDESGCFDPHTVAEGTYEDELCQQGALPPSTPPLMKVGSTSNCHNNNNNLDDHLRLSADELSFQLQNQLAFNAVHLMQDSPNNWDPKFQEMNGGGNHQSLSLSSLQETTPCLPMAELLNLFQLPGSPASSLLLNSSISFANPTQKVALGLVGDIAAAESMSSPSVLYDPLQHLNLPPQPPFKDLFQSLQSHGLANCLPR